MKLKKAIPNCGINCLPFFYISKIIDKIGIIIDRNKPFIYKNDYIVFIVSSEDVGFF